MEVGDKVKLLVNVTGGPEVSAGTIGVIHFDAYEDATYVVLFPQGLIHGLREHHLQHIKDTEAPRITADKYDNDPRFAPPAGTSLRLNDGKVQTREIDPAFILGIGEVLTKSREKYDHFNWTKKTKFSTPYESMMRHILSFQSGEDFDKETNSHHLLHAATNIMFLYYHATNNLEESDDRFFKKDKK